MRLSENRIKLTHWDRKPQTTVKCPLTLRRTKTFMGADRDLMEEISPIRRDVFIGEGI